MEPNKTPDLINEFPDLIVEPNGTSGLSIRAKMGKPYNCAEFTMSRAVPVQVFISPWIQFEPVAWNEDRQKLAYEIVRRYTSYNIMRTQLESALHQVEMSRQAAERIQDEQQKSWDDHRGWLFGLLAMAGSRAVRVDLANQPGQIDILQSLEQTVIALRDGTR